MIIIPTHLTHHPRSTVLLAFTVGLILLTALGMEHGLSLPPCQLCHWQRFVHLAAMIVLLTACVFHARYAIWLLVVASLLFIANGMLATYHMGLEYNWWEGSLACSSVSLRDGSLEDIRTSLLAMPIARCDQASWIWLGLSLAGWNAVLSLGLALGSAYTARSVYHYLRIGD